MWELERQLAAAARGATRRLKARNDALEAEVRDLKEGSEAIEERARLELGHDQEGRDFYQVVHGEALMAHRREGPRRLQGAARGHRTT